MSEMILKCLLENTDESNAGFQSRLTPGLPRECFLGIRVPKLREIEKRFRGTDEASEFLKALPHKYYDENMLHSVFISNMKEYDEVIGALEEFLPYVDNWAVCDTLRPKVFRKKKTGLLDHINEWVSSSETYICRFGVDMLMTCFLDDDFKPEYLKIPAAVHSDEYYINMMIAWYYAEALVKQWEETIPYIEKQQLDITVHNRTIQKAIESRRITDEHKAYLRALKRKKQAFQPEKRR